MVARDRDRLAAVRAARAAAAQDYFRPHAAEWDRIRKLHVADEAVEGAIRDALADRPFRSLLDLGTGTGRMLELFGPEHRARARHRPVARHAAARARAARARRPAPLQRAPGRHLRSRRCRQDSFDVVIIHQVLHFLDDGARAIREAARVLRPRGRLLVVDFAPHDLEFLREEHAHRRLGFARRDRDAMDERRRASTSRCIAALPPEPGSDGKIAVSLWLARDPRLRGIGQRRRVMVA